MPDTDGLEPAVQLELSECVRAALHSAISRSDPKSRLSDASDARYSIEKAVKRTLARELRRLNATLSAQERLPIEVWCNIWELLSDVDRKSLPRVCSKWREFFHACPSLWKSLQFYTTCHSPLCKCSSCTGSRKDNFHNPAGWKRHSYPEISTNVSGVLEALSRSRALPLTVSFDMVPFMPNPDVVNCLIDALFPHTGRVTRLHLRVCNPADTAVFLGHFDSLPALRVLELDAVTDGLGAAAMAHHFIKNDLALPVLEELHLHNSHLTWHDAFQHPGLRKLTVHIDNLREIIQILRSCSGLVSLHIKLSSGAQTRRSHLQDELVTLLGTMSLTEVQVSGLHDREGSGWARSTFNPTARPVNDFSVGYGQWHSYEIPWALLNELGNGIHLTYSRTETKMDLRGTDCAGRVRRIWKTPLSGDSKFLREYSWVPSGRTVVLSVDAYEWVLLVSRFSHWPLLESLTIAFSEDADIASVPQDRAQHVLFPVLRSVTVSILAESVQVTAEHVAAFLRTLRLCTPLEILRIDRRVREYDHELFIGFTGRVRID